MEDYTDEQLKAMAFEVTYQINLLKEEQAKIMRELIKRKAIPEKAEVTPDV